MSYTLLVTGILAVYYLAQQLSGVLAGNLILLGKDFFAYKAKICISTCPKITNLWNFELNWPSKLWDNNGWKNTLVTPQRLQSCVLSEVRQPVRHTTRPFGLWDNWTDGQDKSLGWTVDLRPSDMFTWICNIAQRFVGLGFFLNRTVPSVKFLSAKTKIPCNFVRT